MQEPVLVNEQVDNAVHVFHTLRHEIINLTIPPGTPISENEVCDRFAVSRTPVRTAFQRLKDAKLINIIPYKGTHVSRINLDHIKQTIYMRIAVESKVLRDFIDIYEPLTLEKIRYSIRKQIVLLDTEFVPEQFYREDSLFHRIWFKATGKELLWRKIQHSQVHYTRFRMLDIIKTQNFEAIEREHEKLFGIIEKNKKDEVEPFITKHLHGGIDRLGSRIFKEFSEYFEDSQ